MIGNIILKYITQNKGGVNMNHVIKTLEERVSLRRYKDLDIREEDLETILKSAMKAPTAGNMQLYSIIVIKDEETKKKLSRTCDNQDFIAKAPIILLFLADMQRWFDYYDYCNVKKMCEEKEILYNGPEEADLFLACCDALIAAQNAVIAAESLGIGSCYIGDIMENYEIHREIFGLPKWTFPIALLPMGYYPEDFERVHRERFDSRYIVFDEKYKRLKKEDFEEMFKNRGHMDYDKLNVENFGQFMYFQKTGADFSIEMARSVKKALENWKGEIL